MRYVKKPIVIEAIQWNGFLEDFKPWMDKCGNLPIILSPLPALTIKTLEGDMLCNIGDYVIAGVYNEFYPCKKEIFEATYVKVLGEIG